MARPWSPSLELIERMTARSLACLASLGKCGPSSIPGTADWMGLKGPLLAWPGLGSNVSVWLGPPDIQRRMHDLRRLGCAAASAARASIQPEAEAPKAPAAASRIICRRVSCGARRFRRLMATLPFAPDGRESGQTGQTGRTLDGERPGGSAGQWFRWNSGPFKMAQKMSANALAWSSSVFLRSTYRTRSTSSSGLGTSGQGREVQGFDSTWRVQERGRDDRAQHLAGHRVGGAVDVRPVHHRQRLDDRRVGLDGLLLAAGE